MRVAAIDVGSNAIRFLAAEFEGPRQWRELESVRVPVRLGHEAFTRKRLNAEAMDRAVAALDSFGRRMRDLRVQRYRAVATSAVRESRNGGAFVERVREQAGVELEAITGAEEARLVWTAIGTRLPDDERPWVMMDLGGGSVEVSLADTDGIRWSESHTLGTVRLLEELGQEEDAAPERLHRLLDEYAAVLQVPAAARELELAGMLATGGNIETLAAIGGRGPDEHGVSRLDVDRLAELAEELSHLSVDQRMDRYQLRPDRADVILPAAVVYLRIARLCDAEQLVVPNVGVKEGILYDLVDDLATHRTAQQRQEREITSGAGACRPAGAAENGRPVRARVRPRGPRPDPPAARAARRMKIAFLSDVHANLPALEAALDAAERHGADRLVLAGDLVGDGPFPVEVVERLAELDAAVIRGNVDRKVLAWARKPDKVKRRLRRKPKGQKGNRAWTAAQLLERDEALGWLRDLPAELELQIAGLPVLVVHGSPLGDTDYLYPSLTPQGLRSKLRERERAPRVLVAGHSHIPFARDLDGTLVVNCGTVGRPADGDPRGSFALVDFGDPEPQPGIVRFAYDVERTAAELRVREVPGIEPDQLRQGVKR